MKKRMLFMIATIVAFTLFVPSVMAAEVSATIGETEYATLAEAIVNAKDKDTIVLADNIELTSELLIEKELTIDLNGKNISLVNEGDTIKVNGGNLTVTGKGKIEEQKPYYAPIMVIGTNDQSVTNYSILTVGKDVTLKGWAGIFVRQTSQNRGYGINITFNGTIETVPDASDSLGSGIYVNGSIQPKASETLENYPVITLGDTAVITSVGSGIYAAGYATWNINGATITGVGSGLGIKSGKFNITDAEVTATGNYSEPEGYDNGINDSGATIQIESNNGYAGNIELNIEGGTFTSENGNVIYEYLSKGSKKNDTSDDTTETSVNSIEISGGTFTSAEEKTVFAVTESFKVENTEFITGGTFSTDEGKDFISAEEELVQTVEGDYVLASETITLTLTAILGDEKESQEGIFKKGYTLTDEEITELEELEDYFNEEYKKDNLEFKGFFLDEEGKTEVDFTKALDEDTTWYMIIGEIEEETPEELPPKTSDINLALLIGTILVGATGVVAVSKKRLARR